MSVISSILGAIPLLNKIIDGISFIWKKTTDLITRKKHQKIDDIEDDSDLSELL